MPFSGEGLRAPALAIDIAARAAPISGRTTVSAAVATAAALAISGSVAQANQTSLPPQLQPPGISRNAPTSIPNSVNSAFEGLSGSRAPSLGRVNFPNMGASPSALEASAPGLLGGGGAGAGGAGKAALQGAEAAASLGGLRAALPGIAGKLLSPLNPLTAILPDLFFPAPTANDAPTKLAPSEAQKEAAAKRKAERGKQARKGEKPSKFNPSKAYGIYNIRVAVSYPAAAQRPDQTFDIGNIAGKIDSFSVGTSDNYLGSTNSLTVQYSYGSQGYVNFTQGYGWFNPQTGKNEPASSVTPSFNFLSPLPTPANAPSEPFEQPTGNINPIFLGDFPILPTLQGNKTPQLKTPPPGSPTPPVRPADPLPSAPSPATPQKTPEAKPSTETPLLPQLAPLLPLIPMLPGTPGQGGGNINSPNVQVPPSPFTASPTIRNQESLQPPKLESEIPKEITTPEGQCCKNTADGLEEIKKVLGVGEFPATLPLLTNDGTRLINNIPDLLLWTNSNIDATQGMFPATVTVVKPDSTEKTFKLENTAHAFEELFSALLTVAEDVDATVNIAARNATEIVNTKIAVNQGNQLLHAMQKFLGFAVLPAAKLMKINFSPAAAGLDNKLQNDEMGAFLKPSVQSYVGTELGEKQEVLPMLQRILQNSEIARMAVWQPLKPGKKGEDSITGTRLRERKEKPTPAEKKQWEAYIKILKDAGYEVEDNSPNKGTTK